MTELVDAFLAGGDVAAAAALVLGRFGDQHLRPDGTSRAPKRTAEARAVRHTASFICAGGHRLSVWAEALPWPRGQ
jgi:hypothetical protein